MSALMQKRSGHTNVIATVCQKDHDYTLGGNTFGEED